MELDLTLARSFAAAHPQEAAAALDPAAATETARVLQSLPAPTAAGVLRRMTPAAAARALERIDAATAAHILAGLEVDATLSLLRRIPPDRQQEVIDQLPEEQSRAVGAVIGFPPDTAGALMDPRMLAFPADMPVSKALRILHREAEHAHYNVYVIDRDQRLMGVVNILEMMRADAKSQLDAVMHPSEHQLRAHVDRGMIVAHPGWREYYSLPVVDDKGRYLGAVRYRTVRRLERELAGTLAAPTETAIRALGDLFWTGLGGFFGAFASGASSRDAAPPRPQPTTEQE